MTRTQRAIFVDFRTEIGRSQKSHFLFLNIARRPHITQSELVVLNLSRASCIFGHADIKWVTFMRAGGRFSISQSTTWSRAILKRKRTFFKPYVWTVTAMLQISPRSKQKILGFCIKKQSNHASKKWGALMKHSGKWLPFEQHLFVPKHLTLSQKMRFSVVSQHSSALFLRSAGSAWQELKERYSWISELRLQDPERVTFYFWTLQEDPTSHKVIFFSWTFLELLAYLVMLTSSELLSCVQGADSPYVNQQPEAGRMPCQKEQGML